ncbi:MAG: HAD family hydrolase [Nitrososphaeria archaeon]
MKRVEAVLCDFDDTLIDSSAVARMASDSVAREIARDMHPTSPASTIRRLLTAIRETGEEMERSLEFNRNLWWVEVLQRVNAKVAASSEALRRWTKRYWEEYAKGRPFPDVVSTLEAMRGYSLGIVTNTDGTPGVKRRRISVSGLERYFSAVVVGGEDGVMFKPHPQPFLMAASQLAVSPKQCLVVGDKPFSDVRGAKRAGMLVSLVMRRDWPDLENPDYVILSLSELLSVLRSID